MRFLRSLRGGSGEGPDADLPAGTEPPRPQAGPPRGDAPSDEARSSELMEEFESSLSDLAQRQVRFARFAWEPPAQLDRRGRWLLRGAVDATSEDGKRVGLRAGEGLELDELGEDEPAREAWRFVRVKDGRTVYVEAGAGGAWPDGLERPRKAAEGS